MSVDLHELKQVFNKTCTLLLSSRQIPEFSLSLTTFTLQNVSVKSKHIASGSVLGLKSVSGAVRMEETVSVKLSRDIHHQLVRVVQRVLRLSYQPRGMLSRRPQFCVVLVSR